MVEKNEILSRIEQLMKDRNWSLYRLSSESEIPYNTLRNLYVRNNDPTLETIRKICKCFNISLQDFFADTLVLNDTVSYYTSMENKIIKEYRLLNRNDKKLLQAYLAGLRNTLPPEEDV